MINSDMLTDIACSSYITRIPIYANGMSGSCLWIREGGNEEIKKDRKTFL